MRRTITIATAALACGVGGALGLRAVFPTLLSGARPPPLVLPPREPGAPIPLPQFSLPVSPELKDAVTAENVSAVAASFAERADKQIREDGALAGLGAEATARLRAAIEEQSAIYLSGSFDKYQAWMRRSGGRREFIEKAGADPAARKKAEETVREVWTVMASTIALKPVSIEHAKVRLRWKDGAETPTQDDRFAKVIITSPDCWPALAGDPKANGYTIVEFLYPAFYFLEEGGEIATGGVYFGIWFVWDKVARDWRIHQTRLYNPLNLPYNLTAPQF